MNRPFSAKTVSRKDSTTVTVSVFTPITLATIKLFADVETQTSWRRRSSAKITKRRGRLGRWSWIKKKHRNSTHTSRLSSKHTSLQGVMEGLYSLRCWTICWSWLITTCTIQKCWLSFSSTVLVRLTLKKPCSVTCSSKAGTKLKSCSETLTL